MLIVLHSHCDCWSLVVSLITGPIEFCGGFFLNRTIPRNVWITCFTSYPQVLLSNATEFNTEPPLSHTGVDPNETFLLYYSKFSTISQLVHLAKCEKWVLANLYNSLIIRLSQVLYFFFHSDSWLLKFHLKRGVKTIKLSNCYIWKMICSSC